MLPFRCFRGPLRGVAVVAAAGVVGLVPVERASGATTFFLDFSTGVVRGSNFALALRLQPDLSGAADDFAMIRSFNAVGSFSLSGSVFSNSATGDLRTGLKLSDAANQFAEFTTSTPGSLGASMRFLVTLSGNQFDSALPPVGTSAFTATLTNLGNVVLPNSTGTASTSIYRNVLPGFRVDTNNRIIVSQVSATSAATGTTHFAGAGSYGDATKWTGGTPTPFTDAVIDSGAAATLQAGGYARNLTISSGSSLALNSNALTVAGSTVINNGQVTADGALSFLFSTTLSGSGTTALSGSLSADAALTVDAGHKLTLSNVTSFSAGDVTNAGTIAAVLATDHVTASSLTNNGTLASVGSAFRLNVPTIVNNGLISASGVGGTIDLNPDGIAGGQTITGSGNWSLADGGMNIYGTARILTTGTFYLAPNAVLSVGSGAAGTVITASSFYGGGYVAANAETTLNIIDGDPALPFAGQIGGNPVINKSGPGTLVMQSNLVCAGPVNVTAGTLRADNPVINSGSSATGYGNLTVGGTGTIAGTGSICGFSYINAGGAVSPGDGGPGTLTFQITLLLQAESYLLLDLSNRGASDLILVRNGEFESDQVHVLINDVGLVSGQPCWFLDWTGAIQVGGESISPSDFILDNTNLTGEFIVDNDNMRVGFMTFRTVPEPGGPPLGAGVLVSLLTRRRR